LNRFDFLNGGWFSSKKLSDALEGKYGHLKGIQNFSSDQKCKVSDFFISQKNSFWIFFVDVHFRISLRETPKISDFNALRRSKILPFAMLIEPYGYPRNSRKIKKSYFGHSKYLQNKVKIL